MKDETQPQIPEGYWANRKGELTADRNVSPQDKLKEAVVRDMFRKAEQVEKELADLKRIAFSELEAFKGLVFEKYGVSVGGAKGNMLLKTFDGSLGVEISVQDHISFGPELQAAKELIDQFIQAELQGQGGNLEVLVRFAFQVGKAGRIDTQRVLNLRTAEVEDSTGLWARAMDAIADAIRRDTSTTYVRFYRYPEAGPPQQVKLSLAAAQA